MFRSIMRLALGIVVSLVAASPALASDDFWIVPSSGTWFNQPPLAPPFPPYVPGANTWWSNLIPPQPGDSATFNLNATYRVVIQATPSTLQYLAVSAGDVTFLGSGVPMLTIDSGGSAVVSGPTNLNLGGGAGTAVSLSVGGFGLSAENSGVVNVLSGSQVSSSGRVEIASFGGSGRIGVQGTGSSLTQSGISAVTVGSDMLGSAALDVGTTASGAMVNIGAGGLVINKTGTVNIGGGAATGTMNVDGNLAINGGSLWLGSGSKLRAHGDISLNGGALNRFSQSEFELDPLKNVTAANNAHLFFAGDSYRVGQRNTFTIASGSQFYVESYLDIGTFGGGGDGSVVVDGSHSNLTTGGSYSDIGLGRTGTLTIQNRAFGNLPGIHLAGSAAASPSSGNLSVLSGASLSVGDVFAGTGGSTGTSTIIVNGPESTITQTGAAKLKLGASANSVGNLYVENGGMFYSGTGGTQIAATGYLKVDGGTFNTASLVVNGQLVFTRGTLAISGLYAQTAAGTLAVALETSANIERVSVAGAAVLNGQLAVSFINGFVPVAGSTFKVLHADGDIFGTFSQTTLPTLPSELAWNLVYTPNDVLLQVNSSAAPGDYNRNGVVDAADYTVWRNSYGQLGANLAADGNRDGFVTLLDFQYWKDQYAIQHAGTGAGNSPTVPEPAPLTLLGMALLVLVPLVRRHSEPTRGRGSVVDLHGSHSIHR